jgi:hypothetical protein
MKRFLFGAVLVSSHTLIAQVDLFFTDFQAGMPAAYTIVDNDHLTPAPQVAEYTDAWIVVTDPNNPSDSVAASTSFFQPTGKADRWLITPPLALGAYGNHIAWSARSQDASFPDSYKVFLSTTDNALTSFTDTLGSIGGEYIDWTDRFVNLSTQGYANQTVYIAFVNDTDNGFKLYIDDIHAWKEDPVSVNETDKPTFRVSPNPASDYLHIISDLGYIRSEIYAMDGSLLMTSNATDLQIQHLPQGVHIVRVYTSQGVSTQRFIKR